MKTHHEVRLVSRLNQIQNGEWTDNRAQASIASMISPLSRSDENGEPEGKIYDQYVGGTMEGWNRGACPHIIWHNPRTSSIVDRYRSRHDIGPLKEGDRYQISLVFFGFVMSAVLTVPYLTLFFLANKVLPQYGQRWPRSSTSFLHTSQYSIISSL